MIRWTWIIEKKKDGKNIECISFALLLCQPVLSYFKSKLKRFELNAADHAPYDRFSYGVYRRNTIRTKLLLSSWSVLSSASWFVVYRAIEIKTIFFLFCIHKRHIYCTCAYSTWHKQMHLAFLWQFLLLFLFKPL